MTENEELELAIGFAAEAHLGQRDKQGAPYILHALRVMLVLLDREAQTVGVLHDVIEDTGNDLNDLRDMGFGEPIVVAVDALTRREDEGETYADYIERVALNPLAVRVKLADLRDNLGRMHEMAPEVRARLEPRYLAALHRLEPLFPPPAPVAGLPKED